MDTQVTTSGATAAAQAGDDAQWYKDAIIYELHVKAFYDSNNDGIGDIAGLTSKLDYVQELGVNTIWLLPFYPSPMKDDGYDVSDYHNVAPAYGTRHDVRVLVREAHRRGLRVITELIVNHTSDQHPWFQAARRAPRGSNKRDYYVWSDDPTRYAGTRIIFTDTERSNWAWDDVAKAYYWHRFFSHQPDLNFDNPNVLKAVYKTMRFWLDMGVDGFRLDAIPYLVEREGTNNENLPETHTVIKEIRRLVDLHYPNKLLLAEANQWPEDVREYFGDGDECHMAYHFPLMPRMYMAIAQEDRHPITEIMHQTPEIPPACQWAIFLRNHDELTLEMVTSRERDYMYRMYAADPRARINLGIRRRLAPLLDNDVDKIKLMNGLLLSMPGTPVIYYGDEIGMGDNVYLGDRDGVRTPMQWRPDRNAGFSQADPQRLYLPPIMDPVYGYQAVNVEAQSREPSSLLNWMRRMLAARKTVRAFGRGAITFLRPGNRKILAYIRTFGDEVVLCVANLARSAQPVELDLAAYRGRVPVEVIGRTPFPPIGDLPYLLTLPGYGFYWFLLSTVESVPSWHEERLARDELPVLVLFDGWNTLFRDRVVASRAGLAERVRDQLEREALPAYVATQRWYAGKGDRIARVSLTETLRWDEGPASWLVSIASVERESGDVAPYLVPLALVFEEEEERTRAVQPATVARVRQQARVGVMADAFADVAFSRALVAAIAHERELRAGAGVVRCERSEAFDAVAGPAFASLPIKVPAANSSNTIVVLGDTLLLKAYRRLQAGVNPDLEIGRFLTEVVRFPNAVPLAGAIQYVGDDGTVRTLALLQGYISNQGDAWDHTLSYLESHLGELASAGRAPAGGPEEHGLYLALMHTLGQRTAELHGAFATVTGDPAFDPEPITQDDVDAWSARVRDAVSTGLARLESRLATLHESARADALRLLQGRASIEARVARAPAAAGVKTRVHGDYHLGQVLVSKNDFVITDFEGEPARPAEERRAKQSPLKDVAGMLRSFNYARHQAVGQAAAARPDLRPMLEAAGVAWERYATAAFLDGYRATAQRIPLELGPDAFGTLLDLFVIEKAFYELGYEIDNRPDWVRIPLTGLAEYAAGGAS